MATDRKTRSAEFSDLWIEWSGTGGTFTMHRNGGRPVFPLTNDEITWLDKQIAFIFNPETYSMRGTTESIGLALGGRIN